MKTQIIRNIIARQRDIEGLARGLRDVVTDYIETDPDADPDPALHVWLDLQNKLAAEVEEATTQLYLNAK